MGEFKLHLFHDNYHLKRIGTFDNNLLFWIDQGLAFEEGEVINYISTYKFMPDGRLIGCRINRLGKREDYDDAQFDAILEAHLSGLNNHKFCDIQVYPFSVEHDGHIFGAVIRTEDVAPDDPPLVDLMPGSTLLFYPPWEDGNYDT